MSKATTTAGVYSTLGYLTPVEYEARFHQAEATPPPTNTSEATATLPNLRYRENRDQTRSRPGRSTGNTWDRYRTSLKHLPFRGNMERTEL